MAHTPTACIQPSVRNHRSWRGSSEHLYAMAMQCNHKRRVRAITHATRGWVYIYRERAINCNPHIYNCMHQVVYTSHVDAHKQCVIHGMLMQCNSAHVIVWYKRYRWCINEFVDRSSINTAQHATPNKQKSEPMKNTMHITSINACAFKSEWLHVSYNSTPVASQLGTTTLSDTETKQVSSINDYTNQAN